MRESTYLKLSTFANINGWLLKSDISEHPDKPLTWKNKTDGHEIVKRFESVKKTGFGIKNGKNQFGDNDFFELIKIFCASKNIELLSNINRPIRKKFKLFLRDQDGEFYCSYENLLKLKFPRKKKRTIDALHKIAIEKGGKCLSNIYLGPHKKHIFQDSLGNIWEAEANSIWNGTWSQFEADEKKSIDKRFSDDVVRSLLTERNYEWISGEYKNAKSKLTLSCTKGHPWITSVYSAVNSIHDCPQCFGRVSKGQAELQTWINKYYPKANSRMFNINGTKVECDIFIPELKFGVEYDGLYWHSEEVNKHKYNMFRKKQLFDSIGINIIHIYDDKWKNRKEQVINLLMSNINKNEVIYARKCIVKNIDNKEAIEFINENHIQKSDYIKFAVGLFYYDKLVGAMAFRNSKISNSIILDSIAFKGGIRVQGGTSKLLKFSINELSKKFNKIITWSDNRWGSGNVYKTIGFNCIYEFPPDYYYIIKNSRINKQNYKKINLIKCHGNNKTQDGLVTSLGHLKIFDCGKRKWEYTL